MKGEEQAAKMHMRQHLVFLGKSLLVCCSILLVADLWLPESAPLVALAISFYLFAGVYFYGVIKPVMVQDALFWLVYGVFMGVTTVVLNRVCVVEPAISPTCRSRLLEGQHLLTRLFPAIVTTIFWLIARLIRLVQSCRQQAL